MLGERVLLKVSPKKGVMRFRKKKRLSMRIFGHFEILEKFRDVAYRLDLTPNLLVVHPIFSTLIIK